MVHARKHSTTNALMSSIPRPVSLDSPTTVAVTAPTRLAAMIDRHDRELAQGYQVPWYASQTVLREPARPELDSWVVYTWTEPGESAKRYIKYPVSAFLVVEEFGRADPVAYLPQHAFQAPKPARFLVLQEDDWWLVIDACQKSVEYQGLDEDLARLIAATMAREFGNDR